MTRAELDERLSSHELAEWIAYDQLAAFDREQAEREAEMKAKMRRR